MAWFTVIILATGFAARWLARDSVAKVTDRITGTVLVAFGAKLALDSR
jgi:threonine/homoserine/homoserine lactone efflux protein